MIFKEACRWQNYLQSHLEKTISILRLSENVTTTKQQLLKSKAIPTVADEEMISQRTLNYSADDVISFMLYVLEEKEKLTFAIEKAKEGSYLDSMIATNKTRMEVVPLLRSLSNLKKKEIKRRGQDYTFNAEGNQVSYYYDLVETVEPDFNQEVVRTRIKNLLQSCDANSTKADSIIAITEVDYTNGIMTINDSFDEAFEAYLNFLSE